MLNGLVLLDGLLKEKFIYGIFVIFSAVLLYTCDSPAINSIASTVGSICFYSAIIAIAMVNYLGSIIPP